jgi:hypothetical protein
MPPKPQTKRVLPSLDDIDYPVIDDVSKPKKRSTAVAVTKSSTEVSTPKAKPKVDPKDVEDDEGVRRLLVPLASRYKLNIEKIESVIDDDTLGAGSEIIKTLIRVVNNAIPYAENVVIQSEGFKGIHAFTQLLNTTRSLTHDLITLGDRAEVGTRIFTQTIEPMLMGVASQIMTAFSLIESSAKAKMSPQDFQAFQSELANLRIGLASHMNQSYSTSRDAVRNAMS